MKKVKQSKSKWCWAACSVSILYHYGEDVTQSSFVKYVKGTTDNATASREEVKSGLSHWGLSSTITESALSFSTVKSEINNSRPIYVSWQQSSTSHAVVLDGWDNSTETEYVEFMNPSTGNLYSWTYKKFKGGSSYDHTWARSIYKIKQ
ncbi:MAG: C39 family peptidase [Clostridiales bacterium]|nr:C39 family peptidase [Clostridiales bacterium]